MHKISEQEKSDLKIPGMLIRDSLDDLLDIMVNKYNDLIDTIKGKHGECKWYNQDLGNCGETFGSGRACERGQ